MLEDVTGVPHDPWRYRNQVSVVRQLKGLPAHAYSLVTDEIFVDASSDTFTRNRLLVGFGFACGHSSAVELEYLNQEDAHHRPGRTQGSSMTFKVTF